LGVQARSPEPVADALGQMRSRGARLREWLREPLVQFLLIGVLLFAVWRLFNPAAEVRGPANRIVVTEDDLRQMALVWIAQGRPPPTPQQMQSLIETKVREEVLYREALALGLDKDDTIVKRQLARKMEFLAEDVSKLEEPKSDELRAWYEKNKARFALPARASFRHVYFSPDRRGESVRADAERALGRLAGGPMDSPGAAAAGDRFMFQDYYGDRSVDELAKAFGPRFARALVGVKPGAWAGPIESGYGWHVVFVESSTPERIPAYEEIEADVKAAWAEDHRSEVRSRMYEAMRAHYEVMVPAPRERRDAPAATGTRPPDTKPE
jgi:peptidyl-prolyl cis-trans isomerase C